MTPYSTLPFTIKQWAEDDRPREKFLLKGRQALSDAELIAILLSTGTREQSAVDLAKQILALTRNSLTDLGKLSVDDLKVVKGIGEAKSISILAALELGRRRKQEEATQLTRLITSKDFYDLMEPIIGDLPHEEFWVITLNRAHKMTARYRLSHGGVSSTVVDIKLLCRYAVQQLAASIVLVHNHPSGSTQPSDPDRLITRKIKDAVNLFDIHLIDHLIIGNKEFFSFSDSEML
jgi:DNA repair protein RadC